MNPPRILPLVAGTLFASSAMAQAVDPQIAALVEAWVAEEDFSDIVKAYGTACLTPVIGGVPEPARQTIITAGGIEAGIPALETTDPTTFAAVMPGIQECIETLFVGEQILAWLAEERPGLTPEALQMAAFCYMDVVRTLPTELKQAIVQADDFEAGATVVVEQGGPVGTALGAGLEACG